MMPTCGSHNKVATGDEKNSDGFLGKMPAVITTITAAAFASSVFFVYGLQRALERPIQEFFQPLDYVAIAPAWLMPVCLYAFLSLGLHFVSMRSQNFESDEAIAARAPSPKRSWWFRVFPWKSLEFQTVLLTIPSVMAFFIPHMAKYLRRHGILPGFAFFPAIAVFMIGIYYFSHPKSPGPKSRLGRLVVIAAVTSLVIALSQGFYVRSTDIVRSAPVQVSLKEFAKPIEGRLVFSLTNRILLLTSDGRSRGRKSFL
jgi:hypothetical protein